MKFLHTADWQLGCAFSRFGEKAARLREERVRTLRRTLELAQSERVDAFLVAGDLFEDNQVAPALLKEVFGLFAEFFAGQIVLLQKLTIKFPIDQLLLQSQHYLILGYGQLFQPVHPPCKHS